MSVDHELQLTNDQLQQLAFAERNAVIAHKVLLYIPQGEEEAALHILRGWSGLCRIWSTETEILEVAEAIVPLTAYAPKGFDIASCKADIAALQSQASLTGTAQPAIQTVISLPMLQRQCTLLFAVINRIQQKRRRQRLRARFGAAPRRVLQAAVVIAVVTGIAYGARRLLTPTPPWQGSFYGNLELSGPVVGTRNYDNLDFDWSYVSPLPSFPGDKFSLRLDTCLTLDASTKVNLQLGTDDGGKLYVDGEEVISMWGQHGLQHERFSRQLPQGVHQLRIEYFQDGGAAQLILKGSLGNAPVGELPHSALKPPKVWTDGTASCS